MRDEVDEVSAASRGSVSVEETMDKHERIVFYAMAVYVFIDSLRYVLDFLERVAAWVK